MKAVSLESKKNSMNKFNLSGKAPKLDRISACVIYDANNGKILHIHSVATFGGITPRDQHEVEREALSLAKESGRELGNVKALHVNHMELKPHVRYKVDLKKQSLVEDVDMLEELMRMRQSSFR
ncbi:MAG TPA: hypothetical protein VGQ09_05020 [Chitinophagaceae bacterium]|jgi:hypothetical protein|nr:hypothetical protein [Chitinophagaceae bacterium]